MPIKREMYNNKYLLIFSEKMQYCAIVNIIIIENIIIFELNISWAGSKIHVNVNR